MKTQGKLRSIQQKNHWIWYILLGYDAGEGVFKKYYICTLEYKRNIIFKIKRPRSNVGIFTKEKRVPRDIIIRNKTEIILNQVCLL